MQITFHGAARTVTGSQHLIELNGLRILLDCGLYQGPRRESFDRNRHLPFEPESIDAVVLSHAHIDHSGNLPNLTKNGFRGDIVCTFATRDLCSAMLRDSGFIHEKDAEYLNKRRQRGEPPVEPLYTAADAVQSLRFFTGIGYERPYALAPDVLLTFYDAGHMLGSAIVVLDVFDRDAGRDVRLVFSGDLGRPQIPILRDPTILKEADVLILESTYGGRHHPPIEAAEAELLEAILRTVRRGGKVLIPAFAVGRTQQIVYTLNKLYHSGSIPDDLPVYVDSPLAVNVTDVFRLHPEAFDQEASDYLLRQDPDGDLFGFNRLRYIRQVEQSKELNGLRRPAIIISASGMVEHGRILHHLKNHVEDPRSSILIVGWQAPHTLGRRLVEGADTVRIFGEEYERRIEVVVLNGFSGHADHDELTAWAAAFNRRPQRVFLVHGEPEAAGALRKSLRDEEGYRRVYVPERHQSFDI